MEVDGCKVKDDARKSSSFSTRKKRILIVAGFYLPVVGGYIRIINELGKKFSDLGYEVDVLTNNCIADCSNELMDGIHVYRLASINLLDSSYPIPIISYKNAIILKEISRRKYSFVITNTRFYPICLLGCIFSHIHNIPLIHLEHGSVHTVSNNHIVSIISRLYDHTFGCLLVRFADVNFGVSESCVNFLRHIGAKNAKVMHNGIDLSQFKRINSFNKSSDSITITYVGRLVYAKGVQDLLAIGPLLKGNVSILIVGDGTYRHSLESLANQEKLSNVTFLGEKDPEQIPDILSITDIFINPSYSEGLPTSVLEASAAGCAVVATDVGGTDEIVKDGQTGYLVMPGDQIGLAEKINHLIEDKKLRASIGENAKSHIDDNFSWEHIIKLWTYEMDAVEHGMGGVSNDTSEGAHPDYQA